MGFYDTMREAASSLLGRYGEVVTLRRSGGATYDPAAGAFHGGVGGSWTLRAVKTASRETARRAVGGDESRILAGDAVLLFECPGKSANAEEGGYPDRVPRVGDTVTFGDGSVWTVAEGRPLDPAGTALLFAGVIRRG